MKRLALAFVLIASPALAQETPNALEKLWASGTLTTTISTNGCMFVSVGPTGDVIIDRACVEKGASRFKPGAVNDQWDVYAYLLKAVIEKNYSEVSK